MDRVLGVVGAGILVLLALVAVVLSIEKGFSTHKVEQTVQDISQVITNARQGFAQSANGYANYSSANAGSLIQAGDFPSDMVRNGGIVDAWGNAVGFGPTQNNSEVTLNFGGAGLTQDQCVGVATQLSGYVSLVVGGSTFTPANPPDHVTAAAGCAGGTAFALTFQ